MDALLESHTSKLLGEPVVGYWRTLGGASGAETFRVGTESGRSFFVKHATSARAISHLLSEVGVYSVLDGRAFLPRFVCASENPYLLVLEDMSGARWPPPWHRGDVERVLDTIESLRADERAQLLKARGEELNDEIVGRWAGLRAAPSEFLSLRLRSESWLCAASFERIIALDSLSDFRGSIPSHLDLRSDNMCKYQGTWKFIDWSFSGLAHEDADVVLWLPSIVAELGYVPNSLAAYKKNPLLASFAGYLATEAGRPEPPATGGNVRALQRLQLAAALNILDYAWTENI